MDRLFKKVLIMTKDWKEQLKRIQEANKKTKGKFKGAVSDKDRCAMCGKRWARRDRSRASILDNQLRYCRKCARRLGKL